MKKIFYSILLSGMMVLSACDALDLSPEDYYGSNDFWNQKSQVEMFIQRYRRMCGNGNAAWPFQRMHLQPSGVIPVKTIMNGNGFLPFVIKR